MKKIAILTDSACSRSEDIENGIFNVPLYLNFSQFSKKDLEEIKPKELYELLDKEMPTTSAPSIDDFIEKIKYIKSLGYEQILGIALSAHVSGSFNAMRLALESSDIEYKIIDSKRGAVGAGVLIQYARDLIFENYSLAEVYEKVNEKVDDTQLFIILKDLKYAQRGGRISHLKGLLGRILRISPILALDDNGEIYQYETFRGRRRSIDYILDKIKTDLKDKKNYYFALNYSKDISEIEDYKEELKNIIDNAKFYYDTALTAVLGVHAGPDTLVVGYLAV